MTTLILASASPARQKILRSAGISPQIMVSDVDEDAILAALPYPPQQQPADAVLALARAKAESVATTLGSARAVAPAGKRVLVIGCDSMLEFNGEILGKPHTPDVARARWHAMRGNHGVLHTGHWVVELDPHGEPGPPQQGHTSVPMEGHGESGTTTVHFSTITDEDIDAYVATGEPLHVAGAFTIDGIGGAFVERIEGDHNLVVGLSLPMMRRIVDRFNISWPSLWSV
ncbi:Maf family protein [Jonesia quinghaiensis]|uniref:Maf family protein n=1 Tax=Jonesia quinghaiensis TaxID=262806 RepID=UPI0004083CF1|nr:Maf family protein [Jonesia quinghaiensis]